MFACRHGQKHTLRCMTEMVDRGCIATWHEQSKDVVIATAGRADSTVGEANRRGQNALGLVGLQLWRSHC